MWKIFSDCVFHCKKAIFSCTIVNLVQAFVMIAAATVVGDFSDAIFTRNTTYAVENLVWIIVYIFANVVIIPLINYWNDTVCIKGSIQYSIYMFSRFVGMQYEKVLEIPSGQIRSRLVSDVIMYRNFVILVLTKIAIVPLSLIALIILMSHISVMYMLIAFLISLLVLLLPVLTRKIEAKYENDKSQYEAETNTYFHEIFDQIAYVKLYHIREKLITAYNNLYQNFFCQTLGKSILLNEWNKNIQNLMNVAATVGILIVGAVLNAKGCISTGSIMAMVGYYAAFISCMNDVGYIITKFKRLEYLASRLQIFYLYEEPKSFINLEGIAPISVTDVSYKLEDNYLLKKISFSILPGQKVAIIGKNGAGKSTLLHILTGLYRSYDGYICFGKHQVPLDEIATTVLAGCYSYVSQQPMVFEGTVLENIQFGTKNYSAEQIEQILKEIGLFHMRDYVINAQGSNLSGGEMQKISLARAVLKNSQLLIMDEPSNHLDIDGYNWLSEYFSKSKQTILYITHDEAIAKFADKIIEL